MVQDCTSYTDLMPLGEVFAKVKYALNANASLYCVTTDPELLIKLAFSTVTQEDCIVYIKYAGYM